MFPPYARTAPIADSDRPCVCKARARCEMLYGAFAFQHEGVYHTQNLVTHAGGALTALAHRLASFSSLPFLKQKPDGGAAEVRKVLASLYYDLAGSATDGTVQSLRQITSTSHILFGSDFPFTPAAGITGNVEGFRNLKALTTQEHEDMSRNNALGLFTRLTMGGSTLG